MEIEKKGSRANLLFAIVIVFWGIIFGFTLSGLFTSIFIAFPYNIKVVSGTLTILVSLIVFIVNGIISGKRIIRVSAITLFLSFVPIIFSLFSLIVIKGIQDDLNSNMITKGEGIVFFIFLVFPHLILLIINLLLKPQNRIPVKDIKASINFVTAILTSLYTFSSFITVNDIINSFLVILLIPFSLNLLVMAAISYREE